MDAATKTATLKALGDEYRKLETSIADVKAEQKQLKRAVRAIGGPDAVKALRPVKAKKGGK